MLRWIARAVSWLGSANAHARRQQLLVTAALVGGGLALCRAWPTSPAYAAPDRFAAVTAFLLLLTGGAPLLVHQLRQHRAAARIARYTAAPSTIRETVVYIQAEDDLAWRGMSVLLTCGLGCAGLSVIGHWPQGASLAPWRSLLAWLAAAAPLLLLAGLFGRRRHLINGAYLRRALRDQIAYATGQGVPVLHPELRPGGGVAPAGPEAFRAADFVWYLDDFYKSALVVGQIGSGKGYCLLNALLSGLLCATQDSALPISGLILDPKGDWKSKLERLCARQGRSNDLYVIDPEAWATVGGTRRSCAFNPLDCSDSAHEVASRLIGALKALGVQTTDTFFLDAAQIAIRHAIVLLRARGIGPPSLSDVHQVIAEAALKTKSNAYTDCTAALQRLYPAGTAFPDDVLLALKYYEETFKPLNSRQRDGVVGTVTQLLDEFSAAPIAALTRGVSTIRMEDVNRKGAIVYLHAPQAKYPRMAVLLATLIKEDYQKTVLREVDKERPSFLFCDEFQVFFSTGVGRSDVDFLERSRQSRHANVLATQSISALHRRVTNKADVTNFLGSVAVKIFLRNTEEDTNRYASELFGKVSMIAVQPSEMAALDGAFHRQMTTYSRRSHMIPAVPAEMFTRLAVPVRDDPARQHAEAIVHLASRGETRRLTLRWPGHPL